MHREHPAAEAAKIGERGAVELVFERDPAHRQHVRACDTDAAGRHRPLGGAGKADHGAIEAGSFAVKFGQERGDGGEGVGRAGGGAIEGLDEGEGGTAPFAAETGRSKGGAESWGRVVFPQRAVFALARGRGQEGALRRATPAGDAHGELVGGAPDGVPARRLDEVNRVLPARVAFREHLLAAKGGGLRGLEAVEIGRVERGGIAPEPSAADEAGERGQHQQRAAAALHRARHGAAHAG